MGMNASRRKLISGASSFAVATVLAVALASGATGQQAAA